MLSTRMQRCRPALGRQRMKAPSWPTSRPVFLPGRCHPALRLQSFENRVDGSRVSSGLLDDAQAPDRLGTGQQGFEHVDCRSGYPAQRDHDARLAISNNGCQPCARRRRSLQAARTGEDDLDKLAPATAQLRSAYASGDLGAAKKTAERIVARFASCPTDESARLGRSLR